MPIVKETRQISVENDTVGGLAQFLRPGGVTTIPITQWIDVSTERG